MPIRFIDAHGQYGNAAIVLGDLTGEFVGDYTEAVIFAGAIAQRLEDLSSLAIGSHAVSTDVTGEMDASLTGVGGLLTGSVIVNPLHPPPSVSLVLL